MKEAAHQSVAIYKLILLENMIIDKQESLKQSLTETKLESLLMTIKDLTVTRNVFAETLGIVITR